MVNSPEKNPSVRTPSSSGLTTSRYLLLAASIFHLGVCVAVLVAGRLGLSGSVFDARGLGRSFAADSGQYFTHALNLAEVLKHDGLAPWWTASFPLHVKLYSLTLAVIGPLVGFNILAVEPLNLFCYVAILFVVFKLGGEVFGRRVGLVAAIVIAIWPTFLVHTTQVLKDQLFLAAFLGLILCAARLLTKSLSWQQGLSSGLAGGTLVILLWLIRADLWELSLLVVVIATILLMLRAIRDKAIAKGNLVAGGLLLACLFAAPQFFSKYRKPNPHPLLTVSGSGTNQQITINRSPGDLSAPVSPPSRSARGLTRLRERIGWARYLYANYPGTGSGIDVEVRLETWGQIVRYAPRALEIGLFAPFPDSWLTAGTKVGRSGRILSGFETLLMYLIYFLAAVGMWRRRHHLPAWFLLAVALSSLLALSIVTANLGALYRLRYPFWMLLIVIGIDGALELRKTVAACYVAALTRDAR
jgi:hypothetical protein